MQRRGSQPAMPAVEQPALFEVFANGVGYPLSEGRPLLIGRSSLCDIKVTDALVSRRHASVYLADGVPYAEDTASANGVFLNHLRLPERRRVRLADGDTLFVGPCAIQLRKHQRSGERPPVAAPPRKPSLVGDLDDPADLHLSVDPNTPPDSGIVHQPPPERRTESPVGAGPNRTSFSPHRHSRSSVPRGDSTPPDSSTRVDAFAYVGRLADKMLLMGRADAAARILASHLEEIVDGARAGRSLDTELVHVHGHYAFKLASATGQGRYVDLAVQLHTVAAVCMSEGNVELFARLQRGAPLGSAPLLVGYVRLLEARSQNLTESERLLCARLACALPETGL